MEILKHHGMRVTPTREWVIAQYQKAQVALSHTELEEASNGSIDRVTLYRTLQGFEENGIIHKVLDDSGALRYSMCSAACSSHSHHDEHLHFQCTSCNNTTCLEGIHISVPSMPSGYTFEGSYHLAKGVCPSCNATT